MPYTMFLINKLALTCITEYLSADAHMHPIQHLSLISATQEVNKLASREFMHVLDARKTDSSRLTHPFENKHPGNCSLWCYLAERRRSTGRRADRYSAPCYLQALCRTAGNGAIGYSFSQRWGMAMMYNMETYYWELVLER